MTTPTWARSGPRRRALGAAVALLLLITGFAATTQTAGATPATVTAGGLDWGVKSSFRSYLGGPIAHGTTTLGDGATQNGDGTFHFPADPAGTFDAASSTPTASFQGSVHFVGHDGMLDIEISNIRVRNTGAGGVLIADIVSVPFEGTEPPIPAAVTYTDVELVSLAGGTYATASTSASWSAASSTLTAAGEPAFGGFYPAGTAFDPVTFSLTLEAPPTPATGALVWKLSQQAWSASSLAPAHAAGAPAILGSDAWGFPSTAVTYDPATKATDLTLDGSLTVGNINQGGYRIVLDNPSIAVDAAGAGSLSADVSYCLSSCDAVGAVFTTPVRAVVVTFTLADDAVADTGSHVSWTVTPDYPSQNDPTWSTFGQFPQSFLDTLPTSLQGHFKDSLSSGSPSSANVNKPPAPLTVAFDYIPVDPEPVGAVQHITTDVVSGGLTISVADDTVVLPTPALSSDGSTLQTTGEINDVTVIDLRAGDLGWNARGQVGDFASTAGTIDGSGLGWTPNVVSQSNGQTITAGAAVAAGIGDGLTASSTLGSSPAGSSRGTAVFGGALELRAPTNTPPGTYTATLTLTVI